MRTEPPQDKLTPAEMLRQSAAGMAAFRGAALFAAAVTAAAPRSSLATAESHLNSTLLQTRCDGLMDERTVNLVPGFEAVPWIVRFSPAMRWLRIQAAGDLIAGSNA